jgi:hypothetical protein
MLFRVAKGKFRPDRKSGSKVGWRHYTAMLGRTVIMHNPVSFVHSLGHVVVSEGCVTAAVSVVCS